MSNSPGGRDVRYFADDKTEFLGTRNGGSCGVQSLSFRKDSWCLGHVDDADTPPTCFKEHVVVALGAKVAQAKHGELIGYLYPTMDFLPNGGLGRETPSAKESFAIRKGNVTGCPRLDAPTARRPVELSGADRDFVSRDSSKARRWEEKAWRPSPGSVVARLLIGNTISWSFAKGDDCGSTDYYSPDGNVFSASCESAGKIFHVSGAKWKIVDGRFCLQNWGKHPDKDGEFSACGPLEIRSVVSSPGAAAQLHVYFDHALEEAVPNPGFDTEPGLILRGNPMASEPPDRN